jgi:phenylalanyl-tRNA synthetase beta chain
LKELPKGKDYGYMLEGRKRYPLICDSAGNVVALPPIITAETAKIGPETKSVFIDVTGTDKKTVNEVLNIVVCALADRGGKVFGVKMNYPAKKVF